MPTTIRVRKDVHRDLMELCGQIQSIKKERTSPSAAIGLLLRFMKQNQTAFWNYVKNQRGFEEDYEDKIKAMQKNGMPTTCDLTQGK